MTAAERILSKALAASKIDSSQWASIQAGLRDRAFFSAKVTEVRVLHEMRALAAKVAAGELSASEFRDRVRKALSATGYEAKEDEGTIKDLTTRRRLDLIQQTNVRQARGYVQHLEATSQGALLAEPAYELIRVRERAQPRDWITRWKKAGGKIYPGARMIALKTDPIWVAISRFGNPFPPFDYGSGMGIRGIRRSEALRLGVITPETPPQKPPEIHLNGSLQAEVDGVRYDSEEGRNLKKYFGDQIEIANGRVTWQEHVLRDVMEGKAKKVKLGEATKALLDKIATGVDAETAQRFKGKGLGLSHQFYKEHGGKHLNPDEPYEHISKDEFLLVPSMWRAPDRVTRERGDPDRVELWLDTLDGGSLMMVVDAVTGIKSIQKRIRPGDRQRLHSNGALAAPRPRNGTPHIIPKT